MPAPSPSLITLNPSMSRYSKAISSEPPEPRASSSWALNAALFGSPVSGSCRFWWRSRSPSRCRSSSSAAMNTGKYVPGRSPGSDASVTFVVSSPSRLWPSCTLWTVRRASAVSGRPSSAVRSRSASCGPAARSAMCLSRNVVVDVPSSRASAPFASTTFPASSVSAMPSGAEEKSAVNRRVAPASSGRAATSPAKSSRSRSTSAGGSVTPLVSVSAAAYLRATSTNPGMAPGSGTLHLFTRGQRPAQARCGGSEDPHWVRVGHK